MVDANILIAGFLRSATTRELLLDNRLNLWTPEYSLTESIHVLSTPRMRKKIGALAADEISNLTSTEIIERATGRGQGIVGERWRHRVVAAGCEIQEPVIAAAIGCRVD